MMVETDNLLFYRVKKINGTEASIKYADTSFAEAEIKAEHNYIISQTAPGLWEVVKLAQGVEKRASIIQTKPAGSMMITTLRHHKKFYLRRSQNHKLRFSLLTGSDDELLSIVPVIDWQKNVPVFNLQINEEYEKDCTTFIILQALHCTLCSLSMMLGGYVPPVVNI